MKANTEKLNRLNPSDAGIDSLILLLVKLINFGIWGLNPSDAGIDSLMGLN